MGQKKVSVKHDVLSGDKHRSSRLLAGIAHYLYDNATVFLDRKRDKVAELLES
jgi:hypothetical protein